MTTRREFLRTLGATVVASATAPFCLSGCASGLASYRAQLEGENVVVPKTEALSLHEENGILLLHARGVNGPIVLRNMENREIVALSTICTHRGCEVRPLPNSYECPCHGSEYDLDGTVLEGPARLPLRRFPVEETDASFIINVS